MKKFALIFVALCALSTTTVSAQTNCSGFFFVPDNFDVEDDTSFVDLHENLRLRLATTTRANYSALSVPPGFTFHTFSGFANNATFLGEAQAPGTYTFSVAAQSVTGNCYNTYTFQRTYINSPTHICEPIEILPEYIPGEFFVGNTVEVDFFVVNGEDPPFSFYGVDMPAGATIDSVSGVYNHFVTENESYEFTIGVRDAFGCTTMITNDINVRCRTMPIYDTNIPAATRGQYYEQGVPTPPLVHPPYTQFVGSNLPPGLSLSPTGTISGTPTVAGTFGNISVTVTGLGGCTGISILTLEVKSTSTILSPWIAPMCAQSLNERNWKLHNQNSFPITIDWRILYFSSTTGSFVAAPGDNFFSTPNEAWPNTVRITWYDQFGNPNQITQGSNDNLCTPPSCVSIDGITFYQQGRQRNLEPIPAVYSDPEAVRYEPDGLDMPNTDSKSFSLGYYGFITVKLTADLYDQPGMDLKIWENHSGDPSYAEIPERAEVFVSTDNATWVSLGLTNPTGDCHQKLDWSFDLAGKAAWCRYVKVLDRTNEWTPIRDPLTCLFGHILQYLEGTANGFDLDAITCANTLPPGARLAAEEFTDETSLMEKMEGRRSVLSPNPATSSITFSFSEEPGFTLPVNGQVEISIVDMTGRVVTGQMHTLDSEGRASQDVNQLSSGFFVAKVRTQGFARYYKFIKN